jgi:sulfide:quinone oxidoreductase
VSTRTRSCSNDERASERRSSERKEVQPKGAQTLIVGGGIAGLEALLALHDLAEARAELTLVAPDPDFIYKPLVVEEPFLLKPAERHELGPLLNELGGRFVQHGVTGVLADDHAVELDDGSRIDYELLVVCLGGRTRDPYRRAVTFRVGGEPLEIDALLARSEEHQSSTLAFVVPPGVSWPLPIYELALMSRRRAEETGYDEVRLMVITPEAAPLIMFGRSASDAIAELLRVRHIDVETGAYVRESPEGELSLTPGTRRLDVGAAVALPLIEGPNPPGLPTDDHGFIPIDDHARVPGVEDVYAAGDGTTFPIKQGGLAAQQADAAAQHIAARLGAAVDAKPFHPVLRGQLITGVESLHLRHDLTGGHGEGTASADYLWWPPHKVSGRYLAAWLAHEVPRDEPDILVDIELPLTHEWHERPMALDPYGPLGDD